LPVDGGDAKALGLAEGQAVGEALRTVEAWWIEQDFAPDRAQALERLARAAAAAVR
jgi:tRNA nucleotidyltransferase/poly(A) polymerase